MGFFVKLYVIPLQMDFNNCQGIIVPTYMFSHWAWTKFWVKKIDWEWDVYTVKLHIPTNILGQRTKKSVGKWSYGIF